MNWGGKIAVFLGIYMIGIIAVVWFTMTLDVNLVTKNYYPDELVYEEQITRLKNTKSLAIKPSVNLSTNRKLVILTFPQGIIPDKGIITFYRPSDFTKDRKLKINLDEANQQQFATESLLPGLWKAKLLWEKDGKSYFQEIVIVI